MTALAHITAVQPTRDPTDAEAAYLRREGIDPATWAAFNCDRLPAPTGSGILIPTRDPRTPDIIVGQIRIAAGQNKHRFITPPAGLAFADGFTSADRIVLTDHPLLAFRLHQMGVLGVALVEDPSVLPSLLDAFQGRPQCREL
jgi:hypothetical protein